jgi:heme-degrading monooxygenase HmoA
VNIRLVKEQNVPVNRRKYLEGLAAVGVTRVLLGTASAERTQERAHPVQLHVELEVIAGKEKEMEQAFLERFSPVIRRQPGFVEVELLKFAKALEGKPAAPYRLVISFETEKDRLQWVASPQHQHVWPSIGNTLRYSPNSVVLFETI